MAPPVSRVSTSAAKRAAAAAAAASEAAAAAGVGATVAVAPGSSAAAAAVAASCGNASTPSSRSGGMHEPIIRFLRVTGGGGAPLAPSRELLGSAAELTATATSKRQEAAALLSRSSGARVAGGRQGADDDGGDLPAEAQTAAEARHALQLAGAYKQLQEWAKAEDAYLRAIGYHERTGGSSEPKVVTLWLELAQLRLEKRADYEGAAADCAHAIEMGKVAYGPRAPELIPIAERLCKAHVLCRRWEQARDALSFAHDLSVFRNGPEHRDTQRIAEVLQSVEKYAPPPKEQEGAEGHLLGGA
jgi:hypothetical protein